MYQKSTTKIKMTIIIALVSGLTMLASAQQKAETMSNKNVIELTKAGLSNDLIISKINHSVCHFDLSSANMIDLKKQGIKDDVLAAMITKNDEHSITAPNTKAASNDIALLNTVQALVDGKAKPLEKQVSHIRTKMKAFGYGGASSLLEINGGASSVRLNAPSSLKFLIRTDGSSPDIILYHAKVSNDTRQAETMKASMTGLKPVKGIIPTSISALKDNTFEISVETRLESGEYFFTLKQSSNPSSPETFAFGIN